MQVDVGVHAQAALLHIAVGNAEIVQQQFQLGQICLGLGGRTQIGLADDFQKRRARPVQVDAAVGLARHFVVHAFSGVFLEMCADDADAFGLDAALGIADGQITVVAQRQIELADLIALGQVGIIIVFPIPFGEMRNFAIQRDGGLHRQLESLAVHHRQRAGHADAHRTSLRVGRCAELRAASAKHLALGKQLHMHFQTDDDGIWFAHGIFGGLNESAKKCCT